MSTLTETTPVTAVATVEDLPRVRRRTLPLVLHQIRYEQLGFWRNPPAMIFTFVFPVAVIAIFGMVFSGDDNSSFFFGRSGMEYYTPTIAAVSVLGACYGQLAIALSMRRQTGVLKRLHATPLPAWVYFAGLLAHCLLVAAIDVALVIGIGRLYHVPLPARWGPLAAVLVLGAACFCALGAGVASLVSDAEAAPAVVQFVQFPLVFVSGSYFPIHAGIVNTVAGWLPLKPFNDAMLAAFTGDSAIGWKQYGVLAGWGLFGALLAVRRFRWDARAR